MYEEHQTPGRTAHEGGFLGGNFLTNWTERLEPGSRMAALPGVPSQPPPWAGLAVG